VKKNRISGLEKIIKTKKANIGIIGLGYVGLPLAVTFAKKGFRVTGIDINKSRIRKIKKGVSYILDVPIRDIKKVIKTKKFSATTDFRQIQLQDAVIICVPTPLGVDREPDMSYIREAVIKIKDNIKPGQIIVLESTTYPGTTREILLPILESTGLKEGEDFYLAFSPERIDPGNAIFATENTPKVIGGMSDKSTKLSCLLYNQVIKKVVPVSSAGAAEMVKLLENTFRIVNIALVNEIAVLCEKLGLNIWEIIEAAKTKPFGFMPFYPGPGVGGHCIPVDPLYLSWKAREHGFETRFIHLADSVNEMMPRYVVERVNGILAKRQISPDNARILIIGIAYKKDVKDLRESPALMIIDIFQRFGADISYFDPLFPYLDIGGIDLECEKMTKKRLRKFDCGILLADHSQMNYKLLADSLSCIFDTRNVFEKKGIQRDNIVVL